MNISSTSLRRRTGIVAATIGVVASLALAGCASAEPAKPDDTASADIAAALEKESTLTIWSWSPNIKAGADAFMEKYPNITVDVVNAGTGNEQYTKLQNVIKAGSGIPDIATIEYNVLPQFARDLQDLSEYGYDELENEFTASTWNQVNVDSGLYALPRGAGPMALFYNKTVFDKLSLDIPTTWDEYLDAAKKIHAADPNAYIDSDTGSAGFVNSMIWAAGGQPYGVDGTDLSIDMTDKGTQKFSKFWNQLIEQELLSPISAWSNEWYQGLSNGNVATLISGAWMAGTLPSGVPDGAGDWRVAPMPTFEKGEKASAENGGGGDGILNGSENKLVAAAFLKFMNVTDGPAISTKMGFFPAQTDVLESEEFLTAAPEYFGGQEINKIFAQSAEDVVPGWKFLPYNAYAGSIFNDSAGLAYTGKITLQESLEDWGDALKSYGEEQGFTVK